MQNEDFIFYKEKIENIMNSFFLASEKEEEENKFKEIKLFYGHLINSKNLTLSDKKEITYVYNLFFYNFFLNWVIDFLTISITNLYKKEINLNLIVNNDYFVYRFLGNKEKIKNIFNRYYELMKLNFDICSQMIQKNKLHSLFNKGAKRAYLGSIEEHHLRIAKKFNLDDNINSYFHNLKHIIDNEYIFNIIEKSDNTAFFVFNNKNEIVFSDFFKSIFTFYFNFKINDDSIDLKSDDKDFIKKELLKKIKISFQ